MSVKTNPVPYKLKAFDGHYKAKGSKFREFGYRMTTDENEVMLSIPTHSVWRKGNQRNGPYIWLTSNQ